MHCNKCGKTNDLDAKFCEKCGTELAKNHSAGSGDKVDFDLIPTSSDKRLMNFILDYIIYFIFTLIGAFILAVTLAMFGFGNVLENDLFSITFSLILFIIYYVLFEGLYAKSPAKFITKTTVVRLDGSKPNLRQIIGRTFARLIPFEIFSFLGHNPVGWHDGLSRTRVVNDRELHRSEHKTNTEV